jgi:uncharacterized lipoprotein YddW (UPF0748 family)
LRRALCEKIFMGWVFMLRWLAVALALQTLPACHKTVRNGAVPEPKNPTVQQQTSNDVSKMPQVQKTLIGHSREMRGVWVASVFNINWPSKRGLSVAEQKSELIAVLDVCKDVGANAVFLQIRPESDALYASQIEPWSAWLSGTQGKAPSPFYDPLSFAIAEAHLRGLELHAWMNPFRGRYTASSLVAENHVSKRLSQYARSYGGAVVMDPGARAVQEHVVSVFRDVAQRYDIDGIHIDDYFYPYPEAGEVFADESLYANYRAGGGLLAKADWRRDNVNQFIKRSAEALRAIKPHLSFGASPFGIYRPGTPAGTESALDQYEQTFTDPKKWMDEGWVDYVVPQLYWPINHTKFGFSKLLDWWTGASSRSVPIFVGTNLSQLGATGWNVQEFVNQTTAVRERAQKFAMGQLFYNVKNFATNKDGVRDRFKQDLFATPALPPVHERWGGAQDFPGTATLSSGKLLWKISSGKTPRGVVIYKKVNGVWQVFHRSGLLEGAADVAAGDWAITAVDAWAGESFAKFLTR